MLAYALSRPHAKVEMTHPRLSSPLNSPLLVIPDVIMQVENEEEDQNDGIDFSRVRAELDRLLEEGLHESDDDVVDDAQYYINIEVYRQLDRSTTTIKNCMYIADRMSRSL